MAIDLAFLGTGTCNAAERNPSSVALSNGSEVHLIDAGGGCYHQLSRLKSKNFNYKNLTTIILTHFHVDHVGGIPDIIWGELFDWRRKRSDPITFVGPVGLHNFLENRLFPFIGDYEIPFGVNVIELGEGEEYSSNFYTVTAIKLAHSEASTGYIFDFGRKKLGFTGDTGYCENLITLLSRIDSAVMELSLTGGDQMATHLSTADYLKLIKADSLPEKVFINHMYPVSGLSFADQIKSLEDILGDVADRIIFPGDLFIERLSE